jgi:C-terminal processing protease CtpA/Prc
MNRRLLLLLLSATLAPSCGGSLPSLPSGGSTSGTSNCSTLGQCSFVRDALQQYYFWYKELPNPNPSGFASPEAYLEAVRYRPLDSSYSYITSKAANDAFYSESQFIGFGMSTLRSGDLEMRLAQTFPGSPAADAGLDRGHYLVSVGGKLIEDLIRTGEIATIFGPEQVGYTTEIAWRAPGGAVQRATLAKRLVTIPTVSQTAALQAGSARVGYIHLRNFVQPSVEALNTAFSQIRDAGASELVLDLRYNGGGLVSVAQQLASLIGGPALAGRVLGEYVHNDKNTSRNSKLLFESRPQALGVTRAVVITTRAWASASELVINGLRPWIEVKVVGDRSYGKPVGQYSFDFCEKVLIPVSFKIVNARGEGDYFDGIPADCAAADDLDRPLADAREASLAEALYVVRSGRCSGQAAAAELAQADLHARVREVPTNGWQQLVNAW